MQTATQTGSVSKTRRWAGRVISALPVLLMVGTGLFTFINPASAVQAMAQHGYSENLIRPIIVVEIACAVIYAIPRTAVFGAILLTAYLGGATATHVRVGEPFFMPVIVAILVWVGIYLREERLHALVPLRRF